MPFAEPKVRASSWSPEDYQIRFAELRTAWSELPESERTTDSGRASRATMLAEREDLDFEYRCVRAENAAQLDPEMNAARAREGFGLQSPSGGERRSAGELVVENEEFKAWMTRGCRGDSPSVEMTGRIVDQFRSNWQADYEARALVDNSTSSSLLLPVGQPFLPAQAVNQQRLFIRDVLAGGNTTLTAVPYIRELNAITNETGASTVAYGAQKPEATIEFVNDLAPVRDIAVLLPITNQMFDDAAVVVSYINTRLSYMLALREEQQLLTGNGVDPDIKGIRSYSDVQAQAATSGETAITIGNAIAKIQLKNGYPSAVAMNPANYWAMIMKRAAGGSGTFDGAPNAPWSGQPATVWGLPVVNTLSMEAGKALVGDYRLGAQIFDRSQANIRTFEQHSDYAAKNKRLIRCEERLALAVYRPEWFCLATIA